MITITNRHGLIKNVQRIGNAGGLVLRIRKLLFLFIIKWTKV